jgi:hypothetical protein
MKRKGRYRLGSRNPSSKLDEPMVLAIRSSNEPGVVLAKRYGVTPAAVCHIRKRTYWAWLPSGASV